MTALKDVFLSYLLVGLISSVIIVIISIFSARFIKRYGARWLGKLSVLFALIMLLPISLLIESFPLPRFQIPIEELQRQTPINDYAITVQMTEPTQETKQKHIQPIVVTSQEEAGDSEEISLGRLDKDDYKVQYPTANELSKNTQEPKTIYSVLHKNPEVLLVIWIAGILVTIAIQTTHYLIWRRSIMRTRRPVTKQGLMSCLNQAQSASGYYNRISIYQNDKINTPMTVGILRPIILLPNLPYNIENLNFILTHELTHLKRRDHWRKLLFMFASAVHWYNPLAWFMRAKTHRVLELACDETMVTGKPSVYRQRYGETLLSEIKRSNGPRKLLVNCFINEKKNVMKRLQIIIRQRSHKRGLALLSILVTVCIVGSSLFGCESTSKTYGSLTIYYYQDWQNPVSQSIVDRAITLYKKNNPGAEVEIYDPSGGDPEMGVEMISKKLQTDIMAGKGPDVIIDSIYLNLDLYKMASNNMIADLNPFMEEDKSFDESNYYENIVRSYQFDGKQYAMPIYWLDSWSVTTRENLERNGFDEEALGSFSTYIDELYRVMKENGCRFTTLDGDSIYAWNEMKSQIDFENKSLNLLNTTDPSEVDDPQIRRIIEVNELIKEAEKAIPVPQEFRFREVVINGKKLIQTTYRDPNYDVAAIMKEYPMLFTLANTRVNDKLAESGEELLYVPTRMTEDGLLWHSSLYAFLLENSPNKQNGYEFIKLLVSKETQEYGLIPKLAPEIGAFANPIHRGYEEEVAIGLAGPDKNVYKKYIKMLKNPGYDASCPLFRNTYTILDDIMQPYHDGEKSFEECAAEAKDYFEIYFSE